MPSRSPPAPGRWPASGSSRVTPFSSSYWPPTWARLQGRGSELVLKLDGPQVVRRIRVPAARGRHIGARQIVGDGESREAVVEIVGREAGSLELIVLEVAVGIEGLDARRQL